MPSTWSSSNEQPMQPSLQPGPSMKCLTVSWLCPPNKSARVSLPSGPSKTYSFSTLTQGSVRRPQSGDVELHHLQHRLHDPLGLGGVGVAEQFQQHLRHDLPRDAVAVLEPAAAIDQAAGRQRVPQPVDLGLIGAVDLERDRVGVFEPPAAVQRQEALPGESE